jgi:hypothetical protein
VTAVIRASDEPTRVLAARHGVSITRIKELRHGQSADRGGRPPGYPRTGGRQPGTLNKKTVYARQILEEHGADPVEALAKAMIDVKVPLDLRLDCAKALLPYVYPRLAAVEVTGRDGGPVETDHTGEIIHRMMQDDVLVARMESIVIEQQAINGKGAQPEIGDPNSQDWH